MNKEVIPGRHVISILVMFLLGSSLVIGTSPESKQDTWISIIIALLMFIPLALVYARIVNLFPGKDLYEIITNVFGIFIGKLVVILYTFYAVHLCALVMRNLSEFMNIVALPETPQIVILIFLLVICASMVKSGIEALGRWSKYILPVVLVVVVSTFIVGLKDATFSVLKPIGGTGLKSIMKGAFSAFSFPFAESVLVLTLFRAVKTTDKPNKIYMAGTFLAFVMINVGFLRNITLLGVQTSSMHYFQSYEAVSIVSIGDFFTRFEVLMGMNFLLTGFVKICVCHFAATMGLSKIFSIDNYKKIAYLTGILIITFATVIYRNTSEMFEWMEPYKYYALPFQVILPLLILMTAEIKKNRAKHAHVPSQ